MRITLLVHRDVHANVAVNLLLPTLDAHEVTLFLSETVGRPPKGYVLPEDLEKLKFFERDLFLNILSPLAESQASTEGRYLTFSELGRRFGRPETVLRNPNKGIGLEQLKGSRPDLVISIRYGHILRDAAITVPRLGVLNLHSGLLPRYQGILTTLHSLAEGRDEVGCTLHRIDSSAIDAGPIVGRARVPVDRARSLLWHVQELYPAGCAMIDEAVRRLVVGEQLDEEPQVEAEQTYYGLPNERHFTELREKGFAVWHGDDVDRLYRRYIREKYENSQLP